MVLAPVAAEVPPDGTKPAPCTVPPGVVDTRPNPKGVPTRVSFGFYVIDIRAINDVEQSFTADIFLSLRWKDPRLVPLAHCKFRLAEVWNPPLVFLNLTDMAKQDEDIVVIRSDGTVVYRQRFVGDVSSPVDLRDFPFDRQVLPFTFLIRRYTPEEVVFAGGERAEGQAETFSIPGWSIGPLASRVGTFYFAQQDRSFSRIDFELVATRHAGFYVWNMIIPMMIFIFMSWGVFWLDPIHLGTQIGLSATVMVILVVFQLNLRAILPRVAYLTRVDRFVLGSLVLVFLALAEAITSGVLAARGKEALARRLDRWARFIFPAAFVVLLALAFWG